MPKQRSKPISDMTSEELARKVFPEKVVQEVKRIARESDERAEKREERTLKRKERSS